MGSPMALPAPTPRNLGGHSASEAGPWPEPRAAASVAAIRPADCARHGLLVGQERGRDDEGKLGTRTARTDSGPAPTASRMGLEAPPRTMRGG